MSWVCDYPADEGDGTYVVYPNSGDEPDIFHETEDGFVVAEPFDGCVLCASGLCVQKLVTRASPTGRRIVVHARSVDA